MDKIIVWLESLSRFKAFTALLAVLLVYFLTNYFLVFEPRHLIFLFGEEKIPFINWTGAIYFLVFPFLLLLFYLVPKGKFGRAYFIFYAMCVVHFLFFIFFPTTYPRAVKEEDVFFALIRTVDLPNNCFPSMHVSMPIFWALVVLKARKDWVGGLVLVGALVIAATTLTTKQHYVLDVFGGLIIALLAVSFVR